MECGQIFENPLHNLYIQLSCTANSLCGLAGRLLLKDELSLITGDHIDL